jgi:hypothetical protein
MQLGREPRADAVPVSGADRSRGCGEPLLENAFVFWFMPGWHSRNEDDLPGRAVDLGKG